MKLLLVDLDDTLIQSSNYKKILFGYIAESNNVDVTLVNTIYESLKKNNSMNNWQTQFEKALENKINRPVDITASLDRYISQLTVNDGVKDFIHTFIGEKAIFSYGDPIIQNKKITMLNLRSEFDYIIITPTKKLEYLKSMVFNNQVVLNNKYYTDVTLIDNDQKLLHAIQTQLPQIRAIHPDNLV